MTIPCRFLTSKSQSILALAILRKLQQEILLAATMGDAPRMTGYGMSVRSRHALSISCLNKTISMAKCAL
jgi:hypothetical protein